MVLYLQSGKNGDLIKVSYRSVSASANSRKSLDSTDSTAVQIHFKLNNGYNLAKMEARLAGAVRPYCNSKLRGGGSWFEDEDNTDFNGSADLEHLHFGFLDGFKRCFPPSRVVWDI